MILNELFLNEQANTVSIIFGRFNPPHKGHRAAWELASQSADWYVGTNESTQGPKDPLPFDVKIEAMLAIWPELAGHIVSEQSWLTMAAMVYEQHGAVTLGCCTDEDWVTNTIKQYNGKQGAHGYYEFAAIVQQPTPRLSSATALRAAVRAGDREAFADAAGVPADTPVGGNPFFDLVAHYLGQYPEKIKEGMFDAFKKKAAEPQRTPIGPKTRALIVKHFPRNNSDITYSKGQYVLPDNVTAYHGRARINFHAYDDGLIAGVDWHHSEQDAGNPRAVPMAHFDFPIGDASDFEKLKGQLDGKLSEAAYEGNIGAMEMAKFFQVASPEQKAALKAALARKDSKSVWDMLKSVTGTQLKDVKFAEETINELDVSKTMNFIKKAHGQQKYGNKPYWNHPKSVAATGKSFFGKAFGPDAIKVALLHDVVEDTPYQLSQLLKMGFSREVVEAVSLLTKNKSLSYIENIQNIINSGNRLAMMVKYADNYQNFTGDKSDLDPAKANRLKTKYIDSLDLLGRTLGIDKHVGAGISEEASGVIATKAQARDPRYSMSLTKDVRPGEVDRNLRKLSLK